MSTVAKLAVQLSHTLNGGCQENGVTHYREVIVLVLVIQELQAFIVALCKSTLRRHIHHHSYLVSKLAKRSLVAINVLNSLHAGSPSHEYRRYTQGFTLGN